MPDSLDAPNPKTLAWDMSKPQKSAAKSSPGVPQDRDHGHPNHGQVPHLGPLQGDKCHEVSLYGHCNVTASDVWLLWFRHSQQLSPLLTGYLGGVEVSRTWRKTIMWRVTSSLYRPITSRFLASVV